MINIKKRKERKLVLVSLFTVFVIVVSYFIVSATIINYKKKIPGSNEITNTEIPVKFSYEENRDLCKELKDVSANYKDAKAWLKIPGTSIDSVIYQSTDNDRYLRNDKDNNQTRWGENFLDYRCNLSKINEPMQNIIIYGHNTEVDTRFTPLFNYLDYEYYTKHQYIELATYDKNYKFQIFSVYETTTDFYYIDTLFKDIDSYGEFVKSLKDQSQIDTKVEISKEDTILTLSTCDYSNTNGRFVVQAKLIKE